MIVTGMNGQLEVTSELGVGSTFTITLKSELYDKSKEQKRKIEYTVTFVGEKVKEASEVSAKTNRQKNIEAARSTN